MDGGADVFFRTSAILNGLPEHSSLRPPVMLVLPSTKHVDAGSLSLSDAIPSCQETREAYARLMHSAGCRRHLDERFFKHSVVQACLPLAAPVSTVMTRVAQEAIDYFPRERVVAGRVFAYSIDEFTTDQHLYQDPGAYAVAAFPSRVAGLDCRSIFVPGQI